MDRIKDAGSRVKRYSLGQVIEKEAEYLRARRALADRETPADQREGLGGRIATERRPIGLAFSGGGIRSATFNLGVLQALSSQQILPHIDYLSTVSGGGYIGSCFSSLLSRRQPPPRSPEEDPQQLPGNEAYLIGDNPAEAPASGTRPDRFPFNTDPGQRRDNAGLDGARQVRHLRTHGDFIIARKQVLSRDMLRAVGSVLGGLFYHLLVFALFMLLASGVYFTCVSWMVGDLRPGITGLGFTDYLRTLVAGAGVSAWPVHPLVAAFLAGMVTTLISVPLTRWIQKRPPESRFKRDGLSVDDMRENRALLFQVFITLGVAIALTWLFVHSAGERGGLKPVLLTVPLGVYLGGQAAALFQFAVVSILPRFTRNDRSRFAAIKGILNYLCAASFLIVLLPWVVYRLSDFSGSVSLGWIASVIGSGVLMRGGGSGPTAATAGAWMKRLLGLSASIRNGVLAVLVVLVLVGGVVLISSLILRLSDAFYLTPLQGSVTLALGAGLLFVLAGYLLDFNSLSLHYFYRDRLVEAYLQTYAPLADSPDPRPEIKLRDDAEMPLTHLHGWPAGGGEGAAERCVTAAPLHLIVTSLNLTASRDMTRRDRKSDQFVFSKLHCGSQTTGYMTTTAYRGGRTKLARAMTLSGAAASPAMGRGTFFAEAFALTLFNARLGQWMENPRYKDGLWAQWNEGLTFWPIYLLFEMIGHTDANSRLIHLSDGGHTGDNLGIVPLLKRRCAVIVACDAEADPNYAFGSLTEALRQAYIDANIKVDLDLEQVIPASDGAPSRSHCAVGRIRYPATYDADGKVIRAEEVGWLVVLKSSLTGDELARIANYKRDNPNFPQQPTADQFFDDNQFESYRELGYHVAKYSLGTIPMSAWRPGEPGWEVSWARYRQPQKD